MALDDRDFYRKELARERGVRPPAPFGCPSRTVRGGRLFSVPRRYSIDYRSAGSASPALRLGLPEPRKSTYWTHTASKRRHLLAAGLR